MQITVLKHPPEGRKRIGHTVRALKPLSNAWGETIPKGAIANVLTAGSKAGCTLEMICEHCHARTKVPAVPDSAFEFVKVHDGD